MDDKTIDLWFKGLPGEGELRIVSLLGRKKNGVSEFGYYPFRSVHESGSKPTFQNWLNERYERRIVVSEFPTVDSQKIPEQALQEVTCHLRELLDDGSTVVVVDSGGVQRTGCVCNAINFSS